MSRLQITRIIEMAREHEAIGRYSREADAVLVSIPGTYYEDGEQFDITMVEYVRSISELKLFLGY